MEFLQCISLKAAQDLVVRSLKRGAAGEEKVQLIDAAGRIAAQDLFAGENLPPFDRSTVDGFAVNSRDTFGAGEAVPVLLSIVGQVAMGEPSLQELLPGQAVAIPTGGMLPSGADAVVMLEYTEQMDTDTLLISRVAAPFENVVKKGEDVSSADVLVKHGQTIQAQQVGILAACGYSTVPVYKQLKTAIISTGDELVAVSETPKMGQIRDINSYSLGAMLKETGCIVTCMGIVKDNYEEFVRAVSWAAKNSHLVIISGGSSVGARDYTVKAIDALGGVLFHGIAVKPGKPTIYGMAHGIPVFGLPGHPVAAMMVLEQLVKPAANFLMGKETRQQGVTVWARLLRNIPSAPGRDDFVTVHVKIEENSYVAEPIFGKSGLIHTIAEADGVIHIPAEKGGLYTGDLIEVALLKNWLREEEAF
ncbi:MAG: molybdopterin molybdotransferase MoeA [Pelosinus sp.]|nr:molybdopterin molybdotransferase MoeA [Pelosinus sp.]